MKFISTGPSRYAATLEEAITKGLAPDGGVYLPEALHRLSESFLSSLHTLSRTEICEEMAFTLLGGTVTRAVIRELVESSITFDAPLVQMGSSSTFALELFHGPTLAFKDFGARFMAALTLWLRRNNSRELTVLVATSGDTGGAVGHSFHGKPGVRVVILYPSGRVSALQEKQLTTMGGNVHAVEVKGSFDDCQQLVKTSFADQALCSAIDLTSANSINLGRLIPQTFYYALALQQVSKEMRSDIVCSVPSGNFGNLTAGVIAKKMGLPITRFIAATNANDVVPLYLESGIFTPRASLSTLSNAMDVGDPNNFPRLLALYNGEREEMLKEIAGAAFSDKETQEGIRTVVEEYGYVLDPHGSVAYLGLEKHRKSNNEVGIFLHPAHPAKFGDTVRAIVGEKLVVPTAITEMMAKEKKAEKLPNNYDALKEFLLRG